MVSVAALLTVLVAATLLGSVAVVRRLHRPARRWRDRLRSRFVLGVPWGSLLVIAVVLAVYLFVQGGITDFDDPVTIPFRTWSYFYPLGMITASFSHAGPSHLLGNLAGTIVVAPLAEYAWGHYPTDGNAAADAAAGRAGSLYRNPRVRAFVCFPLAVIAVGLATSLFALGPVIGFSGVVFAFAGFAIVHYPIVTIVATLGIQGAILRLYSALQNPIYVYTAQPSPPSAPSWAGIAIQGHALGLFVGFVLGIVLLERRGRRPDPLRLWLAVLLFGFAKGLWAIYWFGGENTYLLYQGPGVVVVAVLALVVTLAVTASERPAVPRRLAKAVPGSAPDAFETDGDRAIDRPLELARADDGDDRPGNDRLERVRELAGGTRDRAADGGSLAALSRKQVAVLAVIGVLALLAGVAVPANFLVVEDASATTETAVQIEDYTVEYVEGVPNGLVSGVGIEAIESDEGLESSGVIVASERRQVWLEAVSAQRLSATGEETVYVGGAGWREAVHVERAGWEPVGNDTVYQVWLRPDGGERRLAHESNESRAEARIAGRNVTVGSDGGEFVLSVTADGTEPATTAIPAANETATAGGLTFERENETIYAAADGTRVAIASEETYNGY
ncbi:rhomboid family intramembrane serine protease [Natrinema thermotolerans]|uniref:Rhomboid family intramembrane serine protease n=1 Tax=Natrinema thermotolerans TaxID=121872 RepID=A0AAF0PEP7_9EURY|nr:rhomboid family intramembrane serine protease [Natrinema thermotolerans]QCC60963.1 rhomboid family intramembrane serine protease [Natrinema thermotolerans]QCC61832.1 rhomboid family intramembrane serine protease [Natrinema thermotolerans]WMT07850.1 rhomboid family intramembrane serine protease [Natrinema thermotolerans]WMT08482.1 rhomboid family intramembrane serine protease [Natrinema thermotolerans]